MLQEEKLRAERDSKEREDLLNNKAELLQADLRRLSDQSNDKQRLVKDTHVELGAYKDLIAEKNEEITKLNNELSKTTEEIEFLTKEKKGMEDELDTLRESRRAAELEVERLKELNDNLLKTKDTTLARSKDSGLEVEMLRRKLEDIENELVIAQREKSQKESDAEIAKEGKRTAQRDLDRLLEANSKLKDENRVLNDHIHDLQINIEKLSQRIDDSTSILDAKEKELRSVRSGISYAEDKGLEANAELARVKKENDTLQLLLDKYRGDAEFQKRLRDEEARKKLEMEAEKKRLEREALNKELEARTVKRELEQVVGSHEKLLDDHGALSEEVKALREHAEVLENQNMTVFLLVNYNFLAPS